MKDGMWGGGGRCAKQLSIRAFTFLKRKIGFRVYSKQDPPCVCVRACVHVCVCVCVCLPIFDLIKLRKLILLFTILNAPDAPLCLQRKFNFLSSVRSTGLRTRACACNLQVPYPRSNSGKRTFAYSAATLFNCLDTDLKQIACVSPCSIYSSRLNNFKH